MPLRASYQPQTVPAEESNGGGTALGRLERLDAPHRIGPEKRSGISRRRVSKGGFACLGQLSVTSLGQDVSW